MHFPHLRRPNPSALANILVVLLSRLIRFLDRLISALLYGLVLLYRYTLSYWLGRQCRFMPSCSEYALEALKTLPLHQAVARIAIRLSSCHPFNGQQDSITYDPVEHTGKRPHNKKKTI